MGWARESVKTPEVTESPRKRIHKTQFFCASTTTTVTSLNLKAISQLKESGKEAHLRVKKTRKCYAGHVKRGQEWLAKHFHATMDPNELSAPEVTATEEDLYEDPMFAAMFDYIPNKTSNKALALFLTYKGFHQNLSQGTVQGIHAAFKNLWDSVDGHTYHGPWQFNNIRQRWEGNPVNSAEVMDITSSLKHKASSEGGDQKHSLPMLKDNMVHILAWSQKTSPKLDQALGWLHHILSGHSELSPIHVHAKKCFELVNLRWKNITIFDEAAVDHVLAKYLAGDELLLSDQQILFEIYLTNCKGWQKKVDKGMTKQDLHLLDIGEGALVGWRDTLICYLLDELHAYEGDYSNALAPIQQEIDQSLVGEAALVQPMSTKELRMVHSLLADMVNIAQSVHALMEIHVGGRDVNPSATAPILPWSRKQPTKPLTIVIPPHKSSGAPICAASTTGSWTMASGSSPHSQAQAVVQVATSDLNDIPTMGLYIPNVQTLTVDGWRDMVRHWVHSAPEPGLETPLKDWPKEWLTGANQHKFTMEHYNCSVIAKEFLNV
ncbi:hypothetical protein V8E55_011275 [Tylopilus felleus]